MLKSSANQSFISILSFSFSTSWEGGEGPPVVSSLVPAVYECLCFRVVEAILHRPSKLQIPPNRRVYKCRQDNCNVRGYFVWALLDNWEWNLGYSVRFGLYYVDYKNNLTRIPKDSAQWFKSILREKHDDRSN